MTTSFRPEGFPRQPIGAPPGIPAPPVPDSHAARYTAPAPGNPSVDALPQVALPPPTVQASGVLVAASIAHAMIAGFFVLAGVGALASGHPGFSPFVAFGLFNVHRVLCDRFGKMGRAQWPILRGPIIGSLVLSLCYAVVLIAVLDEVPYISAGPVVVMLAFVLGINALTLPYLKDAR